MSQYCRVTKKKNILTIHNEISEYFCDLGHLEEDNRMLG